MNFSIILASRQRTELLKNMIESIKQNTFDLGKIEILIGIDDDDEETHQIKESIVSAKFYSRKRSTMLNRDYLNWVYRNHGSGKYIIVCNDDCVFKTKNWDKIILEKLDFYLADKPDGIVYGYISDSLIDRLGLNYCCFPLVTRKAFEVLDIVMPPQVGAWGADIILWQIYVVLNRICDLSEVEIEHISYHSGKRDRDKISHHVETISRKPFTVPAIDYVYKLNEYIKSFV